MSFEWTTRLNFLLETIVVMSVVLTQGRERELWLVLFYGAGSISLRCAWPWSSAQERMPFRASAFRTLLLLSRSLSACARIALSILTTLLADGVQWTRVSSDLYVGLRPIPEAKVAVSAVWLWSGPRSQTLVREMYIFHGLLYHLRSGSNF